MENNYTESCGNVFKDLGLEDWKEQTLKAEIRIYARKEVDKQILERIMDLGEARAKLREIFDCELMNPQFLSKHNTYWDHTTYQDHDVIQHEWEDMRYKLMGIKLQLNELEEILNRGDGDE